jgi:hypothetical protein
MVSIRWRQREGAEAGSVCGATGGCSGATDSARAQGAGVSVGGEGATAGCGGKARGAAD